MADVAVLTMYPTTGPSPVQTGALGHAVYSIDCYDLTTVDLCRYVVLVIPSTVDQEFLARNRAVIRAFLDSGRVLIFGGHLHRDWLPGAELFRPIPTPSPRAYRVARVADHPIFAGVRTDDLTFRRGVAGFFARGHHPVPDGGEVLAWLDGGEPVTYVDQVSTAGTLADADLTGLDGLIVPERIHRGMLNRAAARILELLDSGGTVVAFCGGEPPPEFLPGVRWEHRPTNYWWWLQPDADLALRTPNPDHSFFGHLTLR